MRTRIQDIALGLTRDGVTRFIELFPRVCKALYSALFPYKYTEQMRGTGSYILLYYILRARRLSRLFMYFVLKNINENEKNSQLTVCFGKIYIYAMNIWKIYIFSRDPESHKNEPKRTIIAKKHVFRIWFSTFI